MMPQWSLLPNDATPEREKLLSEIRSVLNTYRGGGRLTQPFNGVESFADSTSPASNQGDHANCNTASGDHFWLQDNYPWVIVRLLPNAQRYVVARFYSRSEADNHKRFLNRFMPAAEFEVVFDAPFPVALDTDSQIPVH
jgi:hypothetical protein